MSTQTQTTRSAELYARACKVLPGGVSRNAVIRDPHPLYVDHAQGCRIVDVEGVERIDFANNMASLIHGHADPDMVRVVSDQLTKGTAFNMGTEAEIEYAEYLLSRSEGFDQLRFVNSGTEALMLAIKAARAYTNRPMIAKAEGAYHGAYDYVEVSQSPSPDAWGNADHPSRVPLVSGTPASAIDDVVVFPYNDTEKAIALLNEHADQLSCVVLDLMPHRVGLNPAEPGFVKALREWTTEHGVLLIIDEVITFRTEFGGMQQQYGIHADLTAMGKMIGGGFAIGAVAGRHDVMDVLNPKSKRYLFPHSGTFSANPIAMRAGLVAMQKFDRPAVDRLNALAERAMAGIKNAIRETGIGASVTGAGSMFRVHMKPTAPRDYREAYNTADENRKIKVLLDHMFDQGFVLIYSCSATLSTPMTETEIDALVAGYRGAFEKIVTEG
ncbi:MAG: aspartate aminotransferase family protein [Phycisphaerales bacterium]|nr:aspartate aminotransferase family protein [Phycisphaerales bacterium]